ncbi:MAG: hypothetical protein IJL94_01700 [Erysipelotrichaceae bacterium]|nr:hypothetical protein [Erysipelotrichaceae bacterium]
MTFAERIQLENDNLTKIILHNDRGLFFCLVERSAYAFCTRIRPFKVHVKSLKGLSKPYVSIGVPTSKIDEYLKDLSVNKDNPEYITALLIEPIDELAFQSWKKHVIEQSQTQNNLITLSETEHSQTVPKETDEGRKSFDSDVADILKEVRALNLAAMTPMEAMLYLNNLQIRLKNTSL